MLIASKKQSGANIVGHPVYSKYFNFNNILCIDRGCLHLGDHSSHTGDHHRLAATVCQLRRIQGTLISAISRALFFVFLAIPS